MIDMYVISEWMLAKILGWTGMDLDEFLEEFQLETVEEYMSHVV